jgi:endonuclease YncB( thermonuclease family)
MRPIRILVLVFILFLSTAAIASQTIYGDSEVSAITSIYDGDTFRCNIAGYPDIVGERISIRINGIDTPEMKDNRPAVKALARKAVHCSAVT